MKAYLASFRQENYQFQEKEAETMCLPQVAGFAREGTWTHSSQGIIILPDLV